MSPQHSHDEVDLIVKLLHEVKSNEEASIF